MRSLIAVAAAAGLAAVAAVELREREGDPGRAPAGAAGGGSAAAAGSPGSAPSTSTRAAAPPDRAPPARGGHVVAKVRAGASVAVRTRPGGRVVARIGDRTDFGSRNALAVIATRQGRRWLGVATTARPHGRLGWIRADGARLAYVRITRSLRVDLSAGRLELLERGRVIRRARVDVGRPGTPTPTGRFGVTDRILGPDYGDWYGCCIIAVSAVQPNLPAGWRGGNRIAVHGTASGRTAGGAAVSAGCLRAGNAILRRLMLELPLGAPVEIRA